MGIHWQIQGGFFVWAKYFLNGKLPKSALMKDKKIQIIFCVMKVTTNAPSPIENRNLIWGAQIIKVYLPWRFNFRSMFGARVVFRESLINAMDSTNNFVIDFYSISISYCLILYSFLYFILALLTIH